jgi:hypothetical protein
MTVSTTSNQQVTAAIPEQRTAIVVEGLVKPLPKSEVNAVGVSFSVGRGEILACSDPMALAKQQYRHPDRNVRQQWHCPYRASTWPPIP